MANAQSSRSGSEPEPAALRLVLYGWNLRTDSPNVTRGQHWAKRNARARLAKEHVWAALMAVGMRRFREPVTIAFTRCMASGCRPMDDDNARAATKPLIDALVACGVIPDDSPKWIASTSVHQIRAKNGKTCVGIEVVAVTKEAASP